VVVDDQTTVLRSIDQAMDANLVDQLSLTVKAMSTAIALVDLLF
jgi:hypothetical protein